MRGMCGLLCVQIVSSVSFVALNAKCIFLNHASQYSTFMLCALRNRYMGQYIKVFDEKELIKLLCNQ